MWMKMLAGLFVVTAAPALAEPLSLDLPGGASAERTTVSYSCSGGHKVTVDYVNAGTNSLAIVRTGEQTILMVNVISGSGARYAGQQFIWWSKGNSADFYDLTKGEDASPEFSCEAAT